MPRITIESLRRALDGLPGNVQIFIGDPSDDKKATAALDIEMATVVDNNIILDIETYNAVVIWTKETEYDNNES